MHEVTLEQAFALVEQIRSAGDVELADTLEQYLRRPFQRDPSFPLGIQEEPVTVHRDE